MTDLELARRRRLALIGAREGAPGVRAVYTHDGRGLALVDEGPGIERRSLRIEGNVVSWTVDGQARSATLSP